MAADRFPLCTRDPDQVIAYRRNGPVTVGRFLAEAEWLAGELPDAEFVINLAADRYRFLRAFAAAMLRGQCTLMPPNQQPQTLAQAAERQQSCYVFAGKEDIAGVQRYPDIEPPVSLQPLARSPEIPDAQLAAIVFTSGSTGESSPNRKYWHTLRHGTLSNIQLLVAGKAPAPDRPLSIVATVPAQHMWGFEMSVLIPLMFNAAISEQTPFFPQEIAASLDSLPRPRLLVSSPVHLKALQQGVAAAPVIDFIVTATAPMAPQLAQDLAATFAATVTDVFGCSESGIIAARDAGGDELWTLATAFELESRAEGTLIKARHLEAAVPLPDIVELRGPSHFRWLGRSQDMINIAGKRGSLADLNQRLARIPGVIDGAIFLPADDATRLAALVVSERLQASDILAALKATIDPVFLPRPIYMVEQLPRSPSSKLPRKSLLAMYAAERDKRKRNGGQIDG
jgi:acyl-coenzyme A synthetase/AMP-(fatty) acid ligase